MQIQAIAQLVLNRQQFLQFVQRRVASAAAAEDIVQNAYIRAIENVSMLRQQESAAAWFYRVLRNAIIDYYRHRSAEDRALERLARDSTDMQPPPKSEEIECECINQVLPVLKPSYSEILSEVDLVGASLETFAKKTGITAGNAAVRVHRARQALKKQLILVCKLCAHYGCVNCTCA
ncbi:RNA polymerase sigma factor [Tunturiibacter gelidoferens]|uniref:RNA polymerase sigma-70 factor (ECF subfamily) n=1 Tax=Tunturiibacter gelidiferens TaxID=3069689 RepID=A0ACC5NVR7_9BACT|nr:sigma-70 family RNA polymerase sigma factor [Edaphobacter lichenicola]MBB5338677.1 RNA polymerase sigma-70 factor (ECF subfamily) [Edaphobacter lichenicola]